MTTPASREERLSQGVRELKRLGVEPNGASVDDLERAVETVPATALAAVDRLGRVASESSARLLAEIARRARDDKLLRREARRALYRLRQKGISVVEVAPADTESTSAPRATLGAAETDGYLSLSDLTGDRLLWMVKPRPAGGILHLSLVVNEPAGLREAVLAETSRKTLRSLRQELKERHGVELVDVDWRYVDAIAAEGYERSRSAGALTESAALYPQLRIQLFATAASEPPLSPVPVDGEDPEALAASPSLLEEPELPAWFLPETVLGPYLARVREIRDSPIVLDPTVQFARIDEIMATATSELFSGAPGRAWRRRLGEAAHFFSRNGRQDAARRAVAVAAALGKDLGGRGLPFCEAVIERSFGLFLARDAEREREEKAGSVLLTPDDIRAERARARKPR